MTNTVNQATQTPTIHWFKEADSPFSNLYPSPIHVFGMLHRSAEHAFQFRKAQLMKNFYAMNMLLKAHSSLSAQHIGQSIVYDTTWITVRQHVMTVILRAKLDQDMDYQKALANLSDDVLLCEDSDHYFWGGHGENVLGQIHMKNKSKVWA